MIFIASIFLEKLVWRQTFSFFVEICSWNCTSKKPSPSFEPRCQHSWAAHARHFQEGDSIDLEGGDDKSPARKLTWHLQEIWMFLGTFGIRLYPLLELVFSFHLWIDLFKRHMTTPQLQSHLFGGILCLLRFLQRVLVLLLQEFLTCIQHNSQPAMPQKLEANSIKTYKNTVSDHTSLTLTLEIKKQTHKQTKRRETSYSLILSSNYYWL